MTAALEDAGTATLLGVYWRRVRSARIVVWLMSLILVMWAALFLAEPPAGPELSLIAGLSALALAMIVTSALVLVRVGRWLPAAERMLAQEPWRPVHAEVLTWDRKPVLALAGLGCVQLTRGTPALLRTIELTGGVDVVGPGPTGWAALRVAGSCWPLPARTVTQPPAKSAPPPAEAGADPVTASVATVAARRVLLFFVMPAVITLIGVAIIAFGLTESDTAQLILGVVLLVLGVNTAMKNLRTARVIRGLPAQLAAASWTAYPVQLNHWQAPRGYATATGTLHTPYDDVLSFELPRANYDLLAAIAATASMHVAGTPRPGEELPVGVPERPVLGYARFRVAGARR